MTAVVALQGRRSGGSFDMRTKQARTLRSIVDGLADELGFEQTALSAVQGRQLQRAAELSLLADEARQRALMGDCVATSELVRIERLAAAARRQLGLSVTARKPQAKDMRTLLAERATG